VILLDTQVLVWYLAGHPSLPAVVRKAIDNSSAVFVSAASIWEIGIKTRTKNKGIRLRGKALDSPEALTDLINECEKQGMRLLEISHEACAIAPFLPGEHKDPFDRIIAAQSLAPERLTVVTGDAAFETFGPGILRLWQSNAVAKKKRPTSAT
jgi:PIN domain nuclease of toxin-antitoxin system